MRRAIFYGNVSKGLPNDPRIIERESRDVVEQLQATGKQADYLVFEDEGHDVLKYANRVTCYTAIAGFFKKHL